MKNKNRIGWIDASKGIAIILVFHYHVIMPYLYKGYTYGVIEGRFITSFTMPVFFLYRVLFSKIDCLLYQNLFGISSIRYLFPYCFLIFYL